MSIDDKIYLRIDESEEAVLRLLSSKISPETLQIRQDAHGRLEAVSETIWAYPVPVVEPRPGYLVELLGFFPTIGIVVQAREKGREEQERTILLDGALKLAIENTCDCVVMFSNSEIVACSYIDGKLALNSRYNIWTPERLSRIGIAYTLEEL